MLIQPMLQRLHAARDLEAMLRAALADVVALHGAERGLIQLFDREGLLVPVQHAGLPRAFLDFFRRVATTSGTVCARATGLGRTVFVRDVEEDPAFQPFLPIARAVPFRSVISTPLTLGKACIGAVSVHFANPVTPSALELHSLEVYCGHVAERICSWHRDHDLRVVAEQLAARLAPA